MLRLICNKTQACLTLINKLDSGKMDGLMVYILHVRLQSRMLGFNLEFSKFQ